MASKQLSNRQEAYLTLLLEYGRDHITQAYKEAGYSMKVGVKPDYTEREQKVWESQCRWRSANKVLMRILPEYERRLEIQQKRLEKKHDVTMDKIVAELSAIAHSDITELFINDDEGHLAFNADGLKALPQHVRRSIQQIEMTSKGLKIKLWPKGPALLALGKLVEKKDEGNLVEGGGVQFNIHLHEAPKDPVQMVGKAKKLADAPIDVLAEIEVENGEQSCPDKPLDPFKRANKLIKQSWDGAVMNPADGKGTPSQPTTPTPFIVDNPDEESN